MKYLIIFEKKYIKHKNQMYLLSERQKTYFKKKKKLSLILMTPIITINWYV